MNDALKNIDTYIKVYEAIKSIQSDIKKLKDDRINLDSRIIAIKIDNLKKGISDIQRSTYNKGLKYEICQCKKNLNQNLNQILIICKLANRLGEKEYFSYLVEKEIYSIQQNFVFLDEELLESIEISSTHKEIKKKISDIRSNVSLKFLRDKLDCLVRNLNEISKSEELLNDKTNLEKLYFYATIFLASLPILSVLGFLFLLIYLFRINSSIFFTAILADSGINGILFFAAVVFFFGVTLLFLPYTVIFTQNHKSNVFDKFITTVLIIISLVFSWIGFWSISTVLGAFITAICWTVVVLLVRYGYKRKGIRRGDPKATVATILIMPILLVGVALISSSILQLSGSSVGLRLENIFRTIGFVQKDYSWFKVNKPYFERTGLKLSNLKIKEEKFTNDYSKLTLDRNENDVFLYGKLWINANNLKILCPPSKIELQEKEDGTKTYTPMDIKAEEVDKKCLVFQSDDLQSIMGFVEQSN